MEISYLIAAAFGLLFCLLALTRRTGALADRLLAAWLATMATQLGFAYALYRFPQTTGPLSGADGGLLALYGPFLFLYAGAMAGERRTLRLRDAWHLLPVALIFAAVLPYLALPPSEKLRVNLGKAAMPPTVVFAGLAIVAALLLYTLATRAVLRRLRGRLAQVYSTHAARDLHWLGTLTMGFALLYTSLCVVSIVLSVLGTSPIDVDRYVYLLISLFVVAIGFQATRQGRVFSEEAPTLEARRHEGPTCADADPASKRLDRQRGDELSGRLLRMMEKEKPYLDGELTLYQLAGHLGTTPHQLSAALNQVLARSFFDLVNAYRVEEVKTRLARRDHDGRTVLAIALECGFNSKASFNRVFRSATGMTPTQYRDLVLSERKRASLPPQKESSRESSGPSAVR
jgi:AraC-like DNA-binding protein